MNVAKHQKTTNSCVIKEKIKQEKIIYVDMVLFSIIMAELVKMKRTIVQI